VYDSGTNAKGKLTSLTDQAGTASYSYDILGRLTAETRPIAGVSKSTSYTYNLNGSVKTLTYPSGRVVTYTPDSAGRLVSAVDGNGTSYVTSASYNPDNSLKSLLNGSTPALNQNFQYTPRLQLCRITTLTSGTLPTSCTDSQHIGNIMDRGYDFHAGNGTTGSGTDNGNVFGITNYRDSTRSQSFTYDALNRLASGWSSADTGAYSWGENYSIDAWGNLQISPMGGKSHGGNFTLSGNAQNRSTGLAYDAAGNLMAYLSATYSYDQENRLSSTAGMSYTYDGNGERVLKSNTSTGAAVKRYWSIGGKTLAEGDGSGNLTAEYIYFGGNRVARVDLPANTVHYYLSDHLGSTSIVASAAGAVEEESDYSPFGTESIVTGPGVNELKFTGKRRDTESQLDYFEARYYSNVFGRFMTPDPIHIMAQKIADPQQWNMYAYVRNNPLRFIDPKGKSLELSGNDKERETVLKALQKAVGDTKGYLYDNAVTTTDKDGNKTTKHYVGIRVGGADGKGPAFKTLNAAANKVSGIINDTYRGALIQFVAPSVKKGGLGPAPFQKPAETSIMSQWSRTDITSGPFGYQQGDLNSDGKDHPYTLTDIVSHELGHVDAVWYHGATNSALDPISRGDAVRMENDSRGRNGEPLRTGHGKPGDVQLTGVPF
jgi:RHS repeat-associated protein